jgi:hypothetical protein
MRPGWAVIWAGCGKSWPALWRACSEGSTSCLFTRHSTARTRDSILRITRRSIRGLARGTTSRLWRGTGTRSWPTSSSTTFPARPRSLLTGSPRVRNRPTTGCSSPSGPSSPGVPGRRICCACTGRGRGCRSPRIPSPMAASAWSGPRSPRSRSTSTSGSRSPGTICSAFWTSSPPRGSPGCG